MAVQPYRHARDNWLETACLLALIYAYFASLLQGVAPSAGINVALLVVRSAIVAYGLWPLVAERAYGLWRRARGAASEPVAADGGHEHELRPSPLHAPLLEGESQL